MTRNRSEFILSQSVPYKHMNMREFGKQFRLSTSIREALQAHRYVKTEAFLGTTMEDLANNAKLTAGEVAELRAALNEWVDGCIDDEWVDRNI